MRTAKEQFEEGLTAIEEGIKKLDHAGVGKCEAAKIASELYRDSLHAARDWSGGMPAMPTATVAPGKSDTIAMIRAEVHRLGITPDELATVFEDNDHEAEGPKGRKKKHDTPA
jgi:hypothetical protein